MRSVSPLFLFSDRGLETGVRTTATHVVRQNRILLAFSSPLNPVETSRTEESQLTLSGSKDAIEMMHFMARAGDGVKDVAFSVKDCRAIYAKAMERGAVSISEPREESDEFGSVVLATVRTYGDTVHTFVERGSYTGVFLPGFKDVSRVDPLSSLLPSPGLQFIDHCVGNQPDLGMGDACNWYEKMLGFHRFWSVDDSQIHSEYSSLRSIVMTDFDEAIKMPINEPAVGKRKSQIQEFVDYHGGAGVQHIALNTNDIITTLNNLRARGTEFLQVPDAYYEDVKRRLAASPVVVKENLDELQRLSILIDFDDRGYLLQIFSKPVEDRPTLFYEVIQRNGHNGFGAGNFRALFEAIERDQALRGNLDHTEPAKADK